jgi:protein TonB
LKLIHNDLPVFPPEAAKQHLSGTVKVRFVVDVHGAVHDMQVVESTAPGVFDAAALASVQTRLYEPPLVNGKPVEVPAQITIKFSAPQSD